MGNPYTGRLLEWSVREGGHGDCVVDFGSSIKRVTFSTADLAKHAELVSFEMEDGFWHPPPAEDADSDE